MDVFAAPFPLSALLIYAILGVATVVTSFISGILGMAGGLILMGVLLCTVLLRTYVIQYFYIPSPSMVPTLAVGDRIMVNKLSYDLHDVHRDWLALWILAAIFLAFTLAVQRLARRFDVPLTSRSSPAPWCRRSSSACSSAPGRCRPRPSRERPGRGAARPSRSPRCPRRSLRCRCCRN